MRLACEGKARRVELTSFAFLTLIQWKEITSLQSHRASMPPISAAQQGMPSPYAQLAISLGVYLGHCFPSSPPSSSSSSPSVPEEIAPADMSCFGFSNVGEVLDLCAAVRFDFFLALFPSSVRPDATSLVSFPLTQSSPPTPSPFPRLPSLPSEFPSHPPSLSSITPAGRTPSSSSLMEVRVVRTTRREWRLLRSRISTKEKRSVEISTVFNRLLAVKVSFADFGYLLSCTDPHFLHRHLVASDSSPGRPAEAILLHL